MRILSVDPGFERVGIAILEKENNKEVLLYSNCFRTSAKDKFSKRLLAIGEEVRQVIEKYRPDILAIETLFFNTNQKTVMKVAEARGVVIFEAARAGLDMHEYTPLQIKIAITGYGRAPKEQIILMTKKLIDVETKKKMLDDEFDAIAIGLTHCAHAKFVYERSE